MERVPVSIGKYNTSHEPFKFVTWKNVFFTGLCVFILDSESSLNLSLTQAELPVLFYISNCDRKKKTPQKD